MKQEQSAAGPLLSIVQSVEAGPTSYYKSLLDSRSSLSCTAYPPSQTDDFLRCPSLWRYGRAWTEKGTWTPHILIGHAIHAGISAELQSPDPFPGDPWQDIMKPMLVAGWQDGVAEWSLDGVLVKLEKGLQKVWKGLQGRLLPPGELLVATEVCLDHPEHGSPVDGFGKHNPVPGKCAIADLVTEKADGSLVITDHKTKWYLDPKWLDKEILQTETSWQLRDYAWRAMVHYQKPVSEVRKHLVILGPTPKSIIMPVGMTDEKLYRWLQSAKFYWKEMDIVKALNQAPQNLTSCQDYGGCKFMTACHTLDGQENHFSEFYHPKQ